MISSPNFSFFSKPKNAADLVKAYDQAGTASVQNTELDKLTTSLAGGRSELRKKYGDAAKAAGSYSDTAEFQKGLDDEVERGYVGYSAALRPRIDALNTQLGRDPNQNGFGTLGPNSYLPPAPGMATPESESAPTATPQTVASSDVTTDGASTGTSNQVNALRLKSLQSATSPTQRYF